MGAVCAFRNTASQSLRMRVMQICSARSIGGGERHVADLCNALTGRGHDIFAAVDPGSPLPRNLSQLHSTNIAEFPLRNALDISSAVQIGRFARNNNVELISAHLAKDYPVAAAAALIAGIPYVITRHVLFRMNRLQRSLLRNAKFVIAPSNAVAESLRRQRLFPSEKIVTIRLGLDIDRFPERVGSRHKGFCVGSIGNLDPVKGFDVLIQAASLVSKTIPDAKFKIVGEDRSRDGRNERELRDLIRRLTLENTVELTGWSDNVAEMLSGFDIFVSSSRSESFGVVIAEAMLSGVPVVASETEGAREIIADPSLGQLVPIGSAEALADAIVDLLNNPAKRQLLAVSGREYARENFSLERMVDETEALYRRAIDMP